MAAAQAAENNEKGPLKANERPPRKRTKTKAQGPKRGKKASLGRLLDMPPEVFNEITMYLLPMDLLSLARSNKFFRNIFMSRSSQRFWKRALDNVPNLPPCPPELSEPQYVSLLFSKTCSSCGGRVLRRMDPYLYVRLCNPCRDEHVVELSLYSPFLPFLPKSDVINQNRMGYIYTLQSEVLKIKGAVVKDGEALPEWLEERAAHVEEQHERSEELEDYLDMLDDERELELDDLKHQRRDEIATRLFEEGWTERDMEPSPTSSTEWNKLVWQPKPITDRIWANLYPKLLPLLKSNREHNDRVDKVHRRRARIKKLQNLAESIRVALPPLVHITLKHSLEDYKASEPTTSTSPALPLPMLDYPDKKIDQPFPSVAELLVWPMIKNIVDDDVSPEDAETKFGEIRNEFDQAVVEWREKIVQDLIDIWNADQDGEGDEVKPVLSTRKGKGKAVAPTKANTRKSKRHTGVDKEPAPHPVEVVLPEFTVTFTKPDGTTTTNLSDLDPNLQLLLRADTVFKSSKYASEYTYPGIAPRAVPFGMILAGPDELMYGERWDASPIKRDKETSALAKELLARLGRSEATSLEMKALGGNFRCGRCNRTLPDSWDHLVSHFATEQRQWKQAQEKIKAEPRSGFVYNSTHDLEPGNPKPFAHYMTPQAAADYSFENSSHDMAMMTCIRCEYMGIQARYFHTFSPGYAFEVPMNEHLRDVHGVMVARFGLDFRRWEHDVQFFDPFESDEEDYDSEGDMW